MSSLKLKFRSRNSNLVAKFISYWNNRINKSGKEIIAYEVYVSCNSFHSVVIHY